VRSARGEPAAQENRGARGLLRQGANSPLAGLPSCYGGLVAESGTAGRCPGAVELQLALGLVRHFEEKWILKKGSPVNMV